MDRTERLRGAQPRPAAHRFDNKRWTLVGPLIAALLCASGAQAQLIPSPPAQFDTLGFIQSAAIDRTLCPSVSDPLLWGGTMMINGIKMIVPCNTILQMPANTITWAQLFPETDANGNVVGSFATPQGSSTVGLNGQATAQAVGQTGLALSDGTGTTQSPFPSFEVRAIGNVVKDASGKDQYIIGLISPVAQQGLNVGSGKINCIDYANGYLYVGGDPSQGCTLASGAPNGSRIQVNDPIGRWGKTHSPDPRFSGDTNNTTIGAATGYPMCVPRVAPTTAPDGGDPFCPKGNRPLNGDARFPTDPFLPNNAPLKAFDMPPPPGQPGADPSGFPDARQQLPFMVGDWVDYSGTLAKDALGNQYISAHTINAALGVFTAPGVLPAYVTVEGVLLGTAGNPVNGIVQEATTRIFVVGFTTDPSRLVDINAVDVNPCTGVETLRLLGTVDPLTQPVRGRFRFHVLGGAFMPPTRDMIIQTHTGQTDATVPFDPLDPTMPPPMIGFANGLGSGQYRLPDFDFIFAENQKFGEPIIPNNFQDMPFLAQGSGPLGGSGPVVGQLAPWPGSPVPPAVTCVNVGGVVGAAPLVNAGPDFAVGPGLPESLFATITQDPTGGPATITWAQTAGPDVGLTPLTGSLTPSFTSPAAGNTLTFKLTVSDFFGTTTGFVNVRVVNPTDSITATAAWRAPVGGIHKVGVKGGILSVTAVDTVTDPTLSLFVVGFGPMQVDPILGLPNYRLKLTGVTAPATVTVRSSGGSESTTDVRIR
ncbi:MAG: hypothetical protein ACJ79H_11415 [Myxococcales bacterium]